MVYKLHCQNEEYCSPCYCRTRPGSKPSPPYERGRSGTKTMTQSLITVFFDCCEGSVPCSSIQTLPPMADHQMRLLGRCVAVMWRQWCNPLGFAQTPPIEEWIVKWLHRVLCTLHMKTDRLHILFEWYSATCLWGMGVVPYAYYIRDTSLYFAASMHQHSS